MTENKKGRPTAGQPTTYKPEYCQMIEDFFQNLVDQIDRDAPEEEDDSRRNKLHRKNKGLVILPTYEGFARIVNSSSDIMHDWGERNPEFKRSLVKCKDMQKYVLLQMALNGKYNQSIVKLMLSNNHGMSDKLDVTSKGGVILNFDNSDKNA